MVLWVLVVVLCVAELCCASPIALATYAGELKLVNCGFGEAASAAGDINDDGLPDILVASSTSATIVFGRHHWPNVAISANLSSQCVITLASIQSVDSLGDINLDGIDDIIIGGHGIVFIIFGHGGTWPSSMAPSGVQFIAEASGDSAGRSVSFGGDVNGDGLYDVIIGADAATINGTVGAGRTYVVFGPKNGTWPSTIYLASMNGTNGAKIDGPAIVDSYTGGTVHVLGDVNCDGTDDIGIGTALGSGGYNGYLVFGQRGVWQSPVKLAHLNGTTGVTFPGSWPTLSAAGDVNGDLTPDVLVGFGGSVMVVFGHPGAWPSTISTVHASTGFTITGITGNTFVNTAKDFNNDTVDDLMIGAFQALSNNGQVLIVFGHRGTWNLSISASAIGLTVGGVVLNGQTTGTYCGAFLGPAGDVNMDGVADVIIQSWQYSVAYVVYGFPVCAKVAAVKFSMLGFL